jgi:hypothetical protein
MRKQFRLWLTDTEGGNMLNEAIPFWKRMHMSPSVPTPPPPPMAAHAPPEEEVPYEVHSERNGKLKGVVDALANELGIAEQMNKSNYLKRAFYHVVGIMHPKFGTGGKVIFAPMAAISDAVVRNAMKDKELDVDNDDTLKMASSPVTLINHLRLLWGGFHSGTTLEGATGNRVDNDRWFTSQDSDYRKARLGKYAQGHKSWHPEAQEAPQATPAASTATKSPVITNPVIARMSAMPDYWLAGADMTKIASVAQDIAQKLNLPLPTEMELKQFLKKKGVIGTIESALPSI